jgi:hypothetical protein
MYVIISKNINKEHPGEKIVSKATVRMEELFENLDYGKCFVSLTIPSGRMFS